MIITKHANIITATEPIICHQVNCMGVMNSGVAKAIRQKWPIVFDKYKQYCTEHNNSKKMLGSVLFVDIGNGQQVANIFGQYKYGYDGTQYTDETSLLAGVMKCQMYSKSIALPYKIGCGLGKGNWERVYSELIKASQHGDIILYKY